MIMRKIIICNSIFILFAYNQFFCTDSAKVVAAVSSCNATYEIMSSIAIQGLLKGVQVL